MKRLLLLSVVLAALPACSALLPKTTETSGDTKTAWHSYQQAEETFARITPRVTTVEQLRAQHLDPRLNANMRVVPRYEIVQLFMVSPWQFAHRARARHTGRPRIAYIRTD